MGGSRDGSMTKYIIENETTLLAMSHIVGPQKFEEKKRDSEVEISFY